MPNPHTRGSAAWPHVFALPAARLLSGRLTSQQDIDAP
jgi:hypothetical protein